MPTINSRSADRYFYIADPFGSNLHDEPEKVADMFNALLSDGNDYQSGDNAMLYATPDGAYKGYDVANAPYDKALYKLTLTKVETTE